MTNDFHGNLSIPMFNGRNFWVNCAVAQTLSLLKHQSYPIEYLFFNSADRVSSLLRLVSEQIESVLYINETRVRTNYIPAFVPHIEQLGIIVDIETPPTFESIHSQLVHRIKEGYNSLLTVQTYYVPHHTQFYQQSFSSGGHSVIVGDYHPDRSVFDIYDDSKDLTHYIHFSYSEDILSPAYNYSMRQAVFIKGPTDRARITTDYFTEGFLHWLAKESSEVSSYSSLASFYEESPQAPLDSLIVNNTLALARGTRLLLADYLKLNACPAPLLSDLHAFAMKIQEGELFAMKCYCNKQTMETSKLTEFATDLERTEKKLLSGLKAFYV